MTSAIGIAQSIYDKSGDLLPHEQEFLTDVYRITMERAYRHGDAIQRYGKGSVACLNAQSIADNEQHSKLAIALNKYVEENDKCE